MTRRSADHSSTRVAVTLIVNGEKRPLDLDARVTLFEETVTDAGKGRVANATFGDYLVPVNADIPDMEVVFVGGPDPFNPIGVKGVGEIGLVGMAAAIANAVFHATGRRVRATPITLDLLL